MVNTPYEHRMMPLANHDEQSLQDYVLSLKVHMEDHVYPGDDLVYAKKTLPEFKRKNGRAPIDRHEVRKAMHDEPYTQMWSSIARSMQEMLWDNVGECVERQLPELIEKARSVPRPEGSLTLNPDLEIPNYVAAVDIHCMPGNYHTEITDDDVFAGALYDRGAYYYVMGLMGGSAYDMEDGPSHMFMEAQSRSVISYVQEQRPDLRPKRILDMGCTLGGSSLAYVDEFPGAEVYAIDVAAPQLRYGHARAEALGKKIHFSQQNAEHTNFPDGYFDLVVTHGVLHETSRKAIRNIMKEAYRLLGPGGITMHADLQFFHALTPHHACYHDWDTHNNNEPFWGTFRDMDPTDLLVTAGFNPLTASAVWMTLGPQGIAFQPVNDQESVSDRGIIFGASKTQ